eukprot:Gb_20612 [translate_table: standard]
MLQRYEELELRVALSRKCDYREACKELAVILRGAYNKVPKNLQALMFQDTLAAFRLLHETYSSKDIAAANLLLQAAEASMPKQKKALAVTEYKHAAVALRRRSKIRQEEAGSTQLTSDALIHIFGFLDVRSLVVAGLVCRFWNLAARDNTLWQAQYSLHFGDPPHIHTIGEHSGNNALDAKGRRQNQRPGRFESREHIDWYEAFREAYKGHPSGVFMSSRAYCRTCKSAIWLNSTRGMNLEGSSVIGNHQHQLKPMLPYQVLHFLLRDSMTSSSSSSSDSDSEGVLIVEQKLSKLWAYPRLVCKSVGGGISRRSRPRKNLS